MVEHYFLERAYSIIIYAILAGAMSLWLLRKNTNIRMTLLVYTLILTALAYFFKPAETLDLYRLWAVAAHYKGLPLYEMIPKVAGDWNGAQLSHIYIAVLYNIDLHLIPAVTALLFYINIFYIIADYSIRKKINHVVVGLVVFFFMSRGVYGEVLNGIRSMLAFSFIARCVYNETYNGVNIVRNIPIYLLAAFFHQAALVLVGIRFVLYVLFEKHGFNRIFYLIILIGICSVFFLYFNTNIVSAFNKADNYISNYIFAYGWEYAFNSIYMLMCIWILFYPYNRPAYSDSFRKDRKFVGSIFFICICLVVSYSIYHRFITFAGFVALPAILEALNIDWTTKHRRRCGVLLVLSVFMLLASGLRGNLNVLRFFE